MIQKRFENRLSKNNLKFLYQNPVWDNEKKDAINVFEMIDLLNELVTKCNGLKKENAELKEKYENCKQECLKTKEDVMILESTNMEYEDALGRLEEENKIIRDMNKIHIKNLQDFKHQVHLLIEICGNDVLRTKYEELIE